MLFRFGRCPPSMRPQPPLASSIGNKIDWVFVHEQPPEYWAGLMTREEFSSRTRKPLSAVIQKCKARSKILFLYLYTSEEPCEGCAAPYGYKHRMRVTTNTATVYKDIIDRRDKVRRLRMFSTDTRLHCTNDGNLGGIVTQ